MSTPPRTAIITGAAQGVGKAIALRLSTDGCQVVVSDSTSQKLLLDELVSKITRTGRAAISVTADVSVESDVEDLVAKTVAHFGSIDIMVANDGAIAQSAHTILDTSVEEWGRVFDPNVTNTLLCYKTAARAMIKQNRGGRIIGVCSSGEKSRCNARSTNNAIRGLTQIAACEWEKYGITVNGYAPGASDAPLVQQMDARVADLLHAGPEAYVEIMKTQTAFGRVNRPEEVVCVVSFLASEEAAFMTDSYIQQWALFNLVRRPCSNSGTIQLRSKC
ncbi:acetoin reductase family protein [Desarmillaria tabescens]|uniref:Acetoin reductase family protein n=1 Tax=Armillaria tabescens TaxID=1929756 RepID=A0AA39N7U5_ARMTA|nr:acetoin reductase family protein [Desarmillaria tabescens]KAK0460623.1 acetoin reductase family protein [Desarmillaria tabescens]